MGVDVLRHDREVRTGADYLLGELLMTLDETLSHEYEDVFVDDCLLGYEVVGNPLGWYSCTHCAVNE